MYVRFQYIGEPTSSKTREPIESLYFGNTINLYWFYFDSATTTITKKLLDFSLLACMDLANFYQFPDEISNLYINKILAKCSAHMSYKISES